MPSRQLVKRGLALMGIYCEWLCLFFNIALLLCSVYYGRQITFTEIYLLF